MNSQEQLANNLVIIDANFILLPFQFKIDFFSEITAELEGKTIYIVFNEIIRELNAKKEREPKATKFQKQLKAGLLYLEKNKPKYDVIVDETARAIGVATDDFLVRKASELKEKYSSVYLATNDQLLRKKARDQSIGIIFLRQKKYLSFERF
ncbi:MAG: PIN domain-containing protein [Promethearchaeota archaeon]